MPVLVCRGGVEQGQLFYTFGVLLQSLVLHMQFLACNGCRAKKACASWRSLPFISSHLPNLWTGRQSQDTHHSLATPERNAHSICL
jgi:hypothetical protein